LVSGKGNLVRRTEELKTLGAKAKKSLPDNVVSIANQNAQLPDSSGLADESET
jgi:DNA recombination protein RmuC